MESLFVYGTLKNPEVQKLVIGRVVESSKDALEGYKLEKIDIDGEIYPILVPDQKQRKPIEGLTISISEEELKKIDEYETEIYQRKSLVLKSGNKAFVYLAKTL